MPKKLFWSNTESLFRFLQKRGANGKRVQICVDNETRTILLSIEGTIVAYNSTYLTLERRSCVIALALKPVQNSSKRYMPVSKQNIFLDDVKKIEILS